MSEQDVKTHLASYGNWLQRSTGLDLAPPDPASTVMESLASPQRSRGRLVVLVAAAVLAVVGAVLLWGDDGSELVDTATSEDPPGPLYVLPSPFVPGTIRNAQLMGVGEAGLESDSEIIVIGVPSGDIYTDLATVWVGAPRPVPRGRSTPLDLPSGPAETWNDLFTVIVQERDGTSIRVMTGRDRVAYASNIVDSLSIDNAGSARVEAAGAFEVIETTILEGGSNDTGTYFEVVTSVPTTDGEYIIVETATSPTPLLGAGALDGNLSAKRIQGTHGWAIARQDADGEWNGIVWQATPNRIIAVSGHAPLTVIQEISESLTIVDEDEWMTSLPDYTTS